MSHVWVCSKDEVFPAHEAMIPATLPGVLFGESLFETLRVINGRVFRLERHLARLCRAAEQMGWHVTPPGNLCRGLATLLRDERVKADDLRVRITLFTVSDEGEVDCLISAVPYSPPPAALYRSGVGARIVPVRLDERAPRMQVKHGNRLPHRLARREALEQGDWEGLLLNSQGFLADGSITNLHFVLGGLLCTPSTAAGALEGIARSEIAELAQELEIPYRTGRYHPALLQRASEAFLTNALVGVLPLVRLDGRPLGEGRPGPLTQRFMEEYNLRRYRDSVDIDFIVTHYKRTTGTLGIPW